MSQDKKVKMLPSARYVGITCPNCGKYFKLVINSNPDRHEYIIDTSLLDETQCPLCLCAIGLNRNRVYGIVKN